MRVMKTVLVAAAAVVVLLVAGVVVVAWTFDPNAYKGLVTDQFAARTGRTLTIDEDLRLAYFPWLAVATGGVTIGSAPSFGGAAQPFASARRVAARVKLLPLLQRRIEIGTVELEGLTLNLARDASSRGNWEDLVEAANAPPPVAPAEAQAPAVRELAIEGVRISDGTVHWRENTDELRYSVTGLSLTTGGIGSGEPVSFEAALQFADEQSGLTAAVAASAVVAAAADGSVTARDVETAVTLNARNGAPARTLEAAATRIAFDRAAETLAAEGLVTDIAGIRAVWQLTATAVLANPTVRGSVRCERVGRAVNAGIMACSQRTSACWRCKSGRAAHSVIAQGLPRLVDSSFPSQAGSP